MRPLRIVGWLLLAALVVCCCWQLPAILTD